MKKNKALEMVRTMINGANEYEKKTGDKNPSVYFSKDNLLIIEQSLQRLESIDNAEPSEALECLEKIIKGFNETAPDIYGIGEVVVENVLLHYNQKEVDIIKQVLLKAQEPKHYIKWEDLDFKEENFPIKVKVGNTEYLLCFHNIGKDQALTIQNYDQLLCTFYLNSYYDKQFFNDLRLERVEE